MIHGFFNIVQKDAARLFSCVKEGIPDDQSKQKKVGAAAIRMLATLGMTLSAFVAYKGFRASSVAGAIFKLALAVAIYVYNHDLFVMACNAQKGMLGQMKAEASSFFKDVRDLLNGDKDVEDAPRYPVTDGTLCRSFWDQLIAGITASEKSE